MKYLLLVHESPAAFAARDHADETVKNGYWGAWMAYSKAMDAVTSNGLALQPPETATRVSIRDGERIIEDGPFADTKEQLGGYFVVEVAEVEAALEWAAKSPAAADGLMEVRGIPDLEVES